VTPIVGSAGVERAPADHGDRASSPLHGPESVLTYLREHGLLPDESLVRGRVQVHDLSGRCRNLLVDCEPGRGLFVKQGVGDGGRQAVRREIEALSLLHEVPALTAYLPRLVRSDLARGIAVIEAIAGAAALDRLHPRRRLSAGIASETGRVLAALHRAAVDTARTSSQVPWVLSVHRPTVIELSNLSTHGQELVRLLQEDDEVCAELDGLAAGWRAQCLLHNDVRWSNLVLAGPEAGLQGGVRLVDWELCAPGDPAWDLGSAFAGYLWSGCTVSASPAWAGGPGPAGRPEAASGEVGAMRALWAAYAGRAALVGAEADELLHRSLRMSIARVLHLALEAVQSFPIAVDDLARTLRFARRILRDPAGLAGLIATGQARIPREQAS